MGIQYLLSKEKIRKAQKFLVGNDCLFPSTSGPGFPEEVGSLFPLDLAVFYCLNMKYGPEMPVHTGGSTPDHLCSQRPR